MSLHYAHEKLTTTVWSLVESDLPLRERLLNAWASQGERTPAVDGGALFPDLAERIERLRERLTVVHDGEVGDLAATVRAMTDDEVREVVREILELTSQVEQLYWRDIVTNEA